jgi:parallel beta-helix repeat protein
MPGDNATMTDNVIFDNTGFGIHSYAAPRNQTITRNLIFSNQSGGIILAGAGNRVAFNVLVNNPSGILLFRAGCENNFVQNNTLAYNNTNLAIDSGGGRLGNPTGNHVRANRSYQVRPAAHVSRRQEELLASLSFLEATSLDFQLTPGAR